MPDMLPALGDFAHRFNANINMDIGKLFEHGVGTFLRFDAAFGERQV